jgi:hypothetical protein
MTQEESIKSLEKQGFSFSNWIPAQPDADNNPMDDRQVAVMVKRGATRHGREYREVDIDGSIN